MLNDSDIKHYHIQEYDDDHHNSNHHTSTTFIMVILIIVNIASGAGAVGVGGVDLPLDH